jgi:hypothetical protein
VFLFGGGCYSYGFVWESVLRKFRKIFEIKLIRELQLFFEGLIFGRV